MLSRTSLSSLILGLSLSLGASSSFASEASRSEGLLADQDFADALCNQVVDPLQQGSLHWMACQIESEKLLKAKVNQAQLVTQTCEAIADRFVSSKSLATCKADGQVLVGMRNFEQAQKDMFLRTARSLVACYEKVGRLQDTYDEEGRCSDSSDLSAWNMSSQLRTLAALKDFESLDSRQEIVGTYAGQVLFNQKTGKACTFDLSFTYSGEDITVETANFACR